MTHIPEYEWQKICLDRIRIVEENIRYRTAVKKFLAASGHDLCHENRAELAAAFGLSDIVPTAPATVEEFDAGCKAYQRQIFGVDATGAKR